MIDDRCSVGSIYPRRQVRSKYQTGKTLIIAFTAMIVGSGVAYEYSHNALTISTIFPLL